MQFATNDPRINLLDAVSEARAKYIVDFVTPIRDIEDGKKFIEALHAADMEFHFEDSPETIYNASGRLFTDAVVPLVRARVSELYDLDWSEAGHECPIGYALEVMGHVWE